jgi:hypothetical protein
MEGVFRKIEYWIDGDWKQQQALHKMEWNKEKILKRVTKGKKPMKYGRVDWEKSDDVERGKSSRVRVRFVIGELTKLLKSAKLLLRENDAKQKETRKKKEV